MASFIKSKLKAARDSLGKKDYKAAQEAATQVLEYEPTNYNANVFLGLACLEIGDHSGSERAYSTAIELNPNQALAWQGLSKFYEHTNRWQDCTTALRRLIDILAQQEDSMRCAEILQKYIEIQRSHGTRRQIIDSLSLLLPSSPLYPALNALPEAEPTAPTSTTTYVIQMAMHNSLLTLEEIVTLTETEEEENIKKEVDRRRTRLDAGRPEQIKNTVGREVWDKSKLPSLYNEILNHPNTNDELRRLTESKLLQRKYQHLKSLSAIGEDVSAKQKLLSEVEDLSNGIVLLQIQNELAWLFYIESKDAYEIADYDLRTLRQFTEIFPSLPLTKLLQGYFSYMHLPVRIMETDGEISCESEPEVPTAGVVDDPFSCILGAFAELPDCVLAHRIICEIYQMEMDYESAIKISEIGLDLLNKAETDTGKLIPQTRRGFQVVLAISLVKLYPPKHHLRAQKILSDILLQDPNNIPCLMSQGCVLQYSDQWSEAENIFKRIVGLEPDYDVKLEAKEEWAWCIVRDGRLQQGIDELNLVVRTLDNEEGKEEQKARAWWRLGKSLWDSGDRETSYKNFIISLKRSSTFAPAFTSLGIYYAEVASPPDLDRSSKCFQKAFELDAREAEAARRLAEGFAEEREWDLVEVVARRTIDGEGGLEGGNSGNNNTISARYLPTNAWAWRAVGVVELNRGNYSSATQSFQVALRADQGDFVSWQRLGESYAKSGRHAAAIKALERALEIRPDDWMCLYILGDIYRLMGQYSRAIEIFEDVLKSHSDDICVSLALADTHLTYARSQSFEGFHSRGEASLVASITVALNLLAISPGFRRVTWKVVADALFELSRSVSFHDIDSVRNSLHSLASLVGTNETANVARGIIDFPLTVDSESQDIDGFLALQLAVAAYDYRATLDTLDENAAASAWFDLSMSLTRFSSRTKDQEKSKLAITQAQDLIRKAITSDPGNDVYWNLMGHLNFTEDPKVSQNAYVRALECDAKSAWTWTNLGLLYQYYGDTELANEALFRAQTLDPDYALAWVGQGLVATKNEHHVESHTLFAHAVDISDDVPEADLEFSKRAFKQLVDLNMIQTTARDALLSPFHALDRYCKQRPNDPAALHLFALVCERLNQIPLALDLLSRTIVLLERSYEETEDACTEQQFALANGTLGRLRLAIGDFAGAVEAFGSALSLLSLDDDSNRTKTLRAHAQFGSGLGNFRLGELEDALGMFESALGELPLDMVKVRGHVTVLLAKTLWALGGDEARETARGQLLECISADPENLTAMTTLVAMGILDSDDSLVNAALSEIQALPLSKRAELDPGRIVSRLLTQHHLAQRREKEALSECQCTVHTQPLDHTSRITFASLLLQQKQSAAARAVITGGQAASHRELLDCTLRISAIAAAADVRAYECASRLAQKSVFIAPWMPENWKALAYVRCTGSSIM